MQTISLAEFINGKNVGMVQSGSGVGFLFKAAQTMLITGQLRRQHFEGNFALEPEVLGQVYLAHATGAEQGNHFVVGQHSTGSNCGLLEGPAEHRWCVFPGLLPPTSFAPLRARPGARSPCSARQNPGVTQPLAVARYLFRRLAGEMRDGPTGQAPAQHGTTLLSGANVRQDPCRCLPYDWLCASSRCNQALANFNSRWTVAGEMSSAAAVSS